MIQEKYCKKCKKVIIEDWFLFITKEPIEKEIQCPYCGYVEKIDL